MRRPDQREKVEGRGGRERWGGGVEGGGGPVFRAYAGPERVERGREKERKSERASVCERERERKSKK